MGITNTVWPRIIPSGGEKDPKNPEGAVTGEEEVEHETDDNGRD